MRAHGDCATVGAPRAAGGAAAGLLALMLCGVGAWAQGVVEGPQAAARPRVCLVLAGGGARGAAHIGVIKVLEQLRVPVDCIAGTSMGALVGAAYATGMSAGQMESIVAGLSSEALFVDRPPREDLPIRAKIDEQRNFIGPELGIRAGRVEVQKGIVAGVRLETLLRRLIRFSDVVRFDDLPIPFRAVATDLAGGEPVELAQGQLSEVVRASLSVPVALTPALIDGRVLVDGALTDNLPVDVARRLGADVAIVVDLGSPRVTREELGTYYGLSRQIINILIAQNEKKSRDLLRPADIVIRPELGDFSGADFDHWAAPIPLGEAAAWQMRDRLAALSLSPQAYAQWDRRRRSGPAPAARAIDEIRLPSTQRVDPRAVQEAIHTRTGEPLDADQLEADLRRLYAGGDFERVGYGLLDESGRRVLRIDAVEKSWGPNFLRLGLEGGADLRGESRFELIGSLRRTWIDPLGAEWRNELDLGYDQRASTELYQPLDPGRVLFVAPYALAQRRALDIFAGDQRQARYIVYDVRTGVDLGARLGRMGELRAGLLFGRVDQRLELGPPALSPGPAHVREGAWRMGLRLDQLDRVVAPRSGFEASADLLSSRAALGAQDNYTRWEAGASGAVSFGRSSLDLGSQFGGRFGAQDLPRYQVFQWGGFMHQSGYRIGALNGQSLQFARAVYRVQLAPLPFLNGLYAGFSLEAGRLGRPIAPSGPTGTLKSASAFLLLDSPIGPLYFAYGRARAGDSSLYLVLGQP